MWTTMWSNTWTSMNNNVNTNVDTKVNTNVNKKRLTQILTNILTTMWTQMSTQILTKQLTQMWTNMRTKVNANENKICWQKSREPQMLEKRIHNASFFCQGILSGFLFDILFAPSFVQRSPGRQQVLNKSSQDGLGAGAVWPLKLCNCRGCDELHSLYRAKCPQLANCSLGL